MKIFRRWMILLLLLSLTVPACAGAETKPLSIAFTGSVTLNPGQSANVLKTTIAATESGAVSYRLMDTANKDKVVYEETRQNVKAGDELSWPVSYEITGLTAGKPVKRMKAVFTMDGKSYTYNLFYQYGKKDGVVQVKVEKATWYPNNTACSYGPQFREMRPSLTEKWYMFTPIDLTRQGRQEFEYVAGNMYIIGKVYVDVTGDQVVVTYKNFYAEQGGNTETVSEFVTFLPDLASVTDVEPETMNAKEYAFGQPISIQNDLQGDTNVLLFVRNRVNYRDYVTNSAKLTRFWINHQDRLPLRWAMIDLMDGEWPLY